MGNTIYWHIVSSDPMASFMFSHNARVGQGTVVSVSALSASDPELESAQTQYSYAKIDDEKEKIFETARVSINPALPSRLKSFYVFDDHALAVRARIEWFRDESMRIVECQVLENSVTHRGDAVWLDRSSVQWTTNAESYWRGEMTANPFPEVLVHGRLYFPDWQSFLVGLG